MSAPTLQPRTVTVQVYHCEPCGHEWTPRTKHAPKVCPKCKRENWHEPKPTTEKG